MFQKLIKFATEIMQGQRTEVAVPTEEEQTKGEVSVPTEDVDDGTPRYPPFKRGLPASTPAQIIKSQGDLIWRIKMVTGLSEGEFDRYVMPVIINYAKFVHLLPASEKHHHRGIGGLFRHGLEVARWSVQIASQHILARDLDPELRKKNEPKWLVCCCIAGLLHDCGKPISDISVRSEDGEITWCPWNCDIYTWTQKHHLDRYFIEWRPSHTKKHEDLTGTSAQELITKELKEYLSVENSSDILRSLMVAINVSDTKNPICNIVINADRESVKRDLISCKMEADSFAYGVPVEKYVINAIQRLLDRDKTRSNGKWKVNQSGGKIFVLVSGLYIVWDSVEEILDLLKRDGIPAIPTNKDTLAKIIIEHGYAEAGESETVDDETKIINPYHKITPVINGEVLKLTALKFSDPEYLFQYDAMPNPLPEKQEEPEEQNQEDAESVRSENDETRDSEGGCPVESDEADEIDEVDEVDEFGIPKELADEDLTDRNSDNPQEPDEVLDTRADNPSEQDCELTDREKSAAQAAQDIPVDTDKVKPAPGDELTDRKTAAGTPDQAEELDDFGFPFEEPTDRKTTGNDTPVPEANTSDDAGDDSPSTTTDQKNTKADSDDAIEDDLFAEFFGVGADEEEKPKVEEPKPKAEAKPKEEPQKKQTSPLDSPAQSQKQQKAEVKADKPKQSENTGEKQVQASQQKAEPQPADPRVPTAEELKAFDKSPLNFSKPLDAEAEERLKQKAEELRNVKISKRGNTDFSGLIVNEKGELVSTLTDDDISEQIRQPNKNTYKKVNGMARNPHAVVAEVHRQTPPAEPWDKRKISPEIDSIFADIDAELKLLKKGNKKPVQKAGNVELTDRKKQQGQPSRKTGNNELTDRKTKPAQPDKLVGQTGNPKQNSEVNANNGELTDRKKEQRKISGAATPVPVSPKVEVDGQIYTLEDDDKAKQNEVDLKMKALTVEPVKATKQEKTKINYELPESEPEHADFLEQLAEEMTKENSFFGQSVKQTDNGFAITFKAMASFSELRAGPSKKDLLLMFKGQKYTVSGGSLSMAGTDVRFTRE